MITLGANTMTAVWNAALGQRGRRAARKPAAAATARPSAIAAPWVSHASDTPAVCAALRKEIDAHRPSASPPTLRNRRREAIASAAARPQLDSPSRASTSPAPAPSTGWGHSALAVTKENAKATQPQAAASPASGNPIIRARASRMLR